MVDWSEKTVRGRCAGGKLAVSGQSVVTSGIYERYFEQDGKRWHHILDPRSATAG
jgi:thiamine biosynthesis lipoprotein ApbE